MEMRPLLEQLEQDSVLPEEAFVELLSNRTDDMPQNGQERLQMRFMERRYIFVV